MAFLSGDPGLIEAINTGKDIHCYIATEVFGEKMGFTYDDINVARKQENHPRHNELATLRNNIKTVTFGVPYGAGARRVAQMTGMDEDAAQKFIDDYFARYPVLKQWLEEQGDFAVQYGYSASPKGRKRFYTIPAPGDPDADGILSQIRRWAGNMPIQAGNVDMLKPALYGIYEDLRAAKYSVEDARILFVVHDEIVMTARTELAPTEQEQKDRGIGPGPIEAIMMKNMSASYSAIITNIVNKIDVVVADVWSKA